jgi:hypothetical protein
MVASASIVLQILIIGSTEEVRLANMVKVVTGPKMSIRLLILSRKSSSDPQDTKVLAALKTIAKEYSLRLLDVLTHLHSAS